MEGIVLTRGTPDACIRAYPKEDFVRHASLYTSDPTTTRLGRVRRRGYFPAAFDVELDAQGRILVPAQLREWAGLEGQVTVVGVGDAIEIWDAGRFLSILDEETSEFSESLGSAERGLASAEDGND